MPRHEPLARPTPGEVLEDVTVKMRRDANGKLVPILPEKPTKATTEAKPDPRDAPDPRSGPMRNIPPYGGGV
ncbi:MAG: hypothetical protein QOI80_3660 [Solirubrobacteraceae bacterium]|jgi:hypothetical protein|nr:hypothetical protein [Solirubrobacteraceae bacterium]